ncbi:cyclin-P isoform X3 [Myripristis murdjan]|uniref:cyclin-P isoform X3 n=1 Tax=Myripristis murdjan TaxID=586833 RepID=UPI001176362F|nr:cyclin N-terminal domain-containing protein 2 isoform X3 [Myripristis murdjan]
MAAHSTCALRPDPWISSCRWLAGEFRLLLRHGQDRSLRLQASAGLTQEGEGDGRGFKHGDEEKGEPEAASFVSYSVGTACKMATSKGKEEAEERRAPLRTWANAAGPKDRWQPPEGDEPKMAPAKMEPECRWDRRLLVSTSDDIIMGFHEDSRTHTAGTMLHITADGCPEEPLLLYPQGFPGLHSLQALVPGLLRHEVEIAMEKLGLIWDRSYAWDIFLDMMKNQFRSSFPNADLPRPFTDATRAVLVDWLVQVHELLHFQDETLYLAIHLLNRSLRQIKVSTVNLQLLGVVCLFLAGKKEECLLPEVSGLCFLMDNSYSRHQLLRMERKVLCGLKFDLSYCPPLHFLLLSASIARCSAKMVWMARYLLELALLEGQCVVFLPVQLAGAALCLARRVLQEPPTPEGEAAWCLASSIHVGSETALLKIMHILAGAAAKAHSRETCATFIKFSSPETMHVSSHPGLRNAPGLLGVPPLHT